jgi:hypothetical protein
MKKPVTFRMDPALLAKARRAARAANRTLTNFVETLLKMEVEGKDRRSSSQEGTINHPQDNPHRIRGD